MLETLLILALFAGAVAYLGRMVWKAFFSRQQAGCAKGCGSCGAVDFEKKLSEPVRSESLTS